MADPIIVLPGDANQFSLEYSDGGDAARRQELEGQWLKFNRTDPATRKVYNIWYRKTNPQTLVSADYRLPTGTPAGRYRIETFIPGNHATTRNAVFAVAANFRQEAGLDMNDNPLAVVDMADIYDVWVPLGEYDLDPVKYPASGRVRQFDTTREDPAKEVSFGPVRWVPITGSVGNSLVFDAPIGSLAERQAPIVNGRMVLGKYKAWVGDWYDANPYLSNYDGGCHSGADLCLPALSQEIRGKPVYAVADGVVSYAGVLAEWGGMVVLEHPDGQVSLPSGLNQRQRIFTRYGHLDDRLQIEAGMPVQRGDLLGFIGLTPGSVAGWHLHFDVSYSDILRERPGYWPDLKPLQSLRQAQIDPESRQYRAVQAALRRDVLANFVDPLGFLKENHQPW
jgi:murein DD-endopeptidase MepM/ murein hydrolase activator NlpD